MNQLFDALTRAPEFQALRAPQPVTISPARLSSRTMRESELNAKRLRGVINLAELNELNDLWAQPSPSDVQAEIRTEGRTMRPFRANPHGE